MVKKLIVENACKNFILHTQHAAHIHVFSDVSFSVGAGECLILSGASGSGKSTLLRSLYGNYKLDSGRICIHDTETNHYTDIASTTARAILKLRHHTIGYVSQFLRVIPRVSVLDLVMEPMKDMDAHDQRAKAESLLSRLNIPQHLWSLAPSTFSGGEKQRVNIAISFARDFPILLLDEPTASLDATNKQVVIDLVLAAKAKGTAIVGIFHDAEVREAIEDCSINMQNFKTT